MATVLSRKPGGSGGGGAPSGPAGGDLGGTYPNPTVTNLVPKTLLDAKGDLIAASAADTPAKLTAGSNDMVLRADSGTSTGLEWAYPPGYELDYAQITSNHSVTATVQASATTVVSLPARVYDGNMVIMVEFFAFGAQTPTTAGNILVVNLWDASTDVGRWAQLQTPAGAVSGAPLYGRWRLTPTAASHTYIAKAWRSGTVNGTILADQAPCFIRTSVVSA